MAIIWTEKTVKISELKPFEKNPRKISKEAYQRLKSSISEMGYHQRCIAQPDGKLIGGHQRLQVFQELGIEKIQILVPNRALTDAEYRRLLIQDNLPFGEFDVDMLAADFTIPELESWGVDQGILNRWPTGAEEGLTDPDAVPEAPVKPVSAPGDVWLLGAHRVMCGDSTKPENLEELMHDDIATFCFTSPPYLDMRDYDKGFDGSLETLTKFIPVAKSYCDFFAVNLGLSRKEGKINRFWDSYIEEAEKAGLPLTAWNVWSRQCMGGSIANMSAMFPIEHEWIFVFGGNKDRVRRTKKNKSAGLHKRISNRQKDCTTKKTKPKMVMEFGRMGSVYVGSYATGEKDHPAAFPVHLPYEYIVACSSEGDIIYEPFGGSGTTMIACEQSNRICRMMELSPAYCDVIITRWQNFTGKEAVHAETGKKFNSRAHVPSARKTNSRRVDGNKSTRQNVSRPVLKTAGKSGKR